MRPSEYVCRWALVLVITILTSVGQAQDKSNATGGKPLFVFRDTGDEAGLFPAVAGIRGHGAGWGDIDGDGWIDLYVGTFHNEGSKANMLFRNSAGKFRLDTQESVGISTRATGVVFADLDNDGDLDLFVGSMPVAEGNRLAVKEGHAFAGCSLFRNEGEGRFTNISKDNGACPVAFGGRSVTVADFDRDGLLDLLVGEEPISGYNGSPTKSSRLFRNKGNLQFEDVSRAAGLPENVPGLGVAVGDVNNDGAPDFFLAASGGGNLLFLNDGTGKFREAPGSRETFAWPTSGGDNMVCGVCFGDVNRDGLLDVIIGPHYSTPWKEPQPVKLYLNRGITQKLNPGIKKGGTTENPEFEDVTTKVGLIPLSMKAPHVEIQDFDNDGWPDIYTSIVKFSADGKPHPMIFKHMGIENDLPKFQQETWAVNDFPNADDIAVKRTGDFFDKMIRDHKIVYTAPGPSGDYDNDGRLDLFLGNWWIEGRSLLLHNETPGGNWLDVQVQGSGNVNRMGIGMRVEVFPAGKSNDEPARTGLREIAIGYGYASGQPAIAHFGLGSSAEVDVVVSRRGRTSAGVPGGTRKQRNVGIGIESFVQRGVKANQRITVKVP